MASPQPTLNELAAKITELSETFTRFLKENNVPEPTFAADSPTSYSNLSAEIFMTRQYLLDALTDMWYLTQGPSESIFNYVHNALPDAAALNTLNYFDFWSAVPLAGSASYAEIAQHVSLPEDVVRRVLQHAVTLRIFEETEPGKSTSLIRHTSRSAALARFSGLKALVSTILDDAGAPMMVLNEALNRYSRGKPALTQNINETSFALFHSGGQFGKHRNSWDLLENDGAGEKQGWRQRNFVEFMRYIKEIFHLEGVVLDAHDWKAAGKATVVDVGGSAGHDAIVLARKFPELRITVQDLPQVKPVFEANLPEDVKDRVSFVEHDFFQTQPVQADIYIFKMILHDWPDEESSKILRALIPALKPGARVILFEYIGNQGENEGPALPRSIQQMGTATDLRLMALFNGKERPVNAWAKIFQDADERFEMANVKANPSNFFAVIEAVWRG
ncbi:sterigmatocystin 8-O-methyltransferase [Rostrohypoxylon terebratum]|nr:sterigmatocystin 8-O-methyltransferase [Rostrohypoxylon terebratum]